MQPSADSSPARRVCRRCGAEPARGARFCLACGEATQSAVWELTCSRCHHVNPGDSSFCRSCGATLAAQPSRSGQGAGEDPAGRRRQAPIIATILAIGLATCAALVLLFDRHEHTAVAGGSRSVTSTSTVVVGSAGSGSAASPHGRERATGSAGKATEPGATQGWPAGFAGYTVALASDVVHADATGAVAQAKRAGLRGVGVVWSSNYSSLTPGYWFVFSGAYRTATAAREDVPAAVRAGFADAYVRQVEE